MEIKELKHFMDAEHNFEIRVISHAGSRLYRVEMEDIEGQCYPLMRRGKPMLFRALDDVYAELNQAGIHRAYLVQWVAHDEVIGRDTHYQSPLTSRVPLVF
ncbi:MULTISPECIES: DUF6482 family protein [unclassified Chromohalobacter]|uniref:DUF6482 family protein n=1 Tax=unclassified Chromohalobacter TaxID=2628571 RepID=UPI0024696DFD|nr:MULTISPECIES: DUF6482 family protein [unclassified Chromohalobacter]